MPRSIKPSNMIRWKFHAVPWAAMKLSSQSFDLASFLVWKMNSLDTRHLRNSEPCHRRPPDKCLLITKLLLTASLLNSWLYLPNDGLSGGWRFEVGLRVPVCMFLYIHMRVLLLCMCSYIYSTYVWRQRSMLDIFLGHSIPYLSWRALSRKLTNSAGAMNQLGSAILLPSQHRGHRGIRPPNLSMAVGESKLKSWCLCEKHFTG